MSNIPVHTPGLPLESRPRSVEETWAGLMGVVTGVRKRGKEEGESVMEEIKCGNKRANDQR